MGINVDPVYPNAKSMTSFQDGLEFQDFVCQTLATHGIILQNLSSKRWQFEVGENLQGFEIKKDDWCTRSQRLSIEMCEKTRADESLPWTPSGIQRNDNTWLYIQGNREILFVFAKNFLLTYYAKMKPELTTKLGTIQTWYLPFSVAMERAAKVIHVT